MTSEQAKRWRDIRHRLRRGGSVTAAVEDCLQAGIAVRVVRHHFGVQDDPKFGSSEDVSHEYGIQQKTGA
jgi:hypothetical protein